MKKFLFISFLCMLFAVFTNTANAQKPGNVPDGCCFWLEQIDPAQVIISEGLNDWQLSKYNLNPIVPGQDGTYGTADDNYAKAEYYYFRFINCSGNPKTKLSIDWEFLVNGLPFDKPLDATPANMRNYMNVELEWWLPLIHPTNFQGSGPLLTGMGLESKITPPYTTINNVKRAVVTDFPGQIDASQYGALYGYFNPYNVQNRWYNYIYADFLEWACNNNLLRIKIIRYTTDEVKAQFKLRERIGGVDFVEWYEGNQQQNYMGGHGATAGKVFGNFWLEEQDYETVSDTVKICGAGSPFEIELDGVPVMVYPPDPYPVIPEDPEMTTLSYAIFDNQYLSECGIEYLDTLVSLTVVWQPVPPAPIKDSVHLCGPGWATLTASAPYEDDTFVFNWYIGQNLNFKIHTGKTFTIPCFLPNLTYTLYVTASVDGCEGAATPYVVRVDRQVRARMNDATVCPSATPFEFCHEVRVRNGYGNYDYQWSSNVLSSTDNLGCIEMLGDCDETQIISVTVTDLFSGCTATAEATISVEDGTASFEIEDITINSEDGSDNNMFQCLYDIDPSITGEPYDIDIECNYAVSMVTITYEDDTTSVNCDNKVIYTIDRTWTLETYCGNIVEKNQTINVLDVDAPRSARTTAYTIQTVYGDDCSTIIPDGTIASLKDSLELYDNCTAFTDITAILSSYDNGSPIDILEDGSIIPFIGTPLDYFVEVTDACENARLIQIFFNPPPALFSVTIVTDNDSLCNTGDLTFELTAETDVAGTYTYQWSSVANSCDLCYSTVVFSSNEETYTVHLTTSPLDRFITHNPQYQVIVTNEYGCRVQEAITITLLPLPDFTYETDSAYYCDNVVITGSITLSPNTYTYYLEDMNNPVTGTTITNLVAGEYLVIAEDEFGCVHSQLITIDSVDIDFTAEAYIAQGDSILCYGGNATISFEITGGAAPFTYFYEGVEFFDTYDLPVGGPYEFLIVDDNGCEATALITITEQPDTLIAFIDLIDTIRCFSAKSASLLAYATGGTAPYTYLWNTGDITDYISGLDTGTYSVEITDANLCPVAVATYIITQPDTLTASIALIDTIKCHGDKSGTLEVSAIGGTTPYTYLWNTGATTATISNLDTGTYFVAVTDANSCIATEIYIITQPDTLEASIALDNTIKCFGDETGELTVSATGGTTPYTYLWSTGATTATISNLDTGTYFVTVTDANLCIATATYIVTQPDTLIAFIDLRDTIKCYGDLTGELEAYATGGTAPYDYEWNTGANTAIISGLGIGTYSVTITDANMCEAVATYIITQPDTLEASIALIDTIQCFGDESATLTASATGGTAPYDYEWNTGAITATISGLGIGTYSVTITDANLCEAVAEFVVTQPDTLALTFTGTSQICAEGEGSITVIPDGGVPPYTYRWCNSETTATISNLDTGTYFVTVTDANGCKTKDSFRIDYYTYVELEVIAVKDCNDNQVSIEFNIDLESGKTAFVKIYVYGYVYDIQDAAIIDSIEFTVTTSGTYPHPYTLANSSTCAFSGINYLYFVATATIELCTFESDPSEIINYTKIPVLYVYENPQNAANHDPLDNNMGGGGPGDKLIYLGEPITHYFKVDDFCNSGENVNLSVHYSYSFTNTNGVTISPAAPITQYLTGGTAGYMRFYTPMDCGAQSEINYSNISEESYFPYRTTTSGWYYYGAYYDFFKLTFFDEKEIRVVLSGFLEPGTYTIKYDLVTHRTSAGGCFYGTPVATTCNSKTIGGYNFYTPGYQTEILATNTMTIIVEGTTKPSPFSSARIANLRVFPNPATNNITLSFEEVEGNARVSIVNLTGSMVLEQQINVANEDIKINLPDLHPGVYFVYVTSNDAVMVRKLIIEQQTR